MRRLKKYANAVMRCRWSQGNEDPVNNIQSKEQENKTNKKSM